MKIATILVLISLAYTPYAHAQNRTALSAHEQEMVRCWGAYTGMRSLGLTINELFGNYPQLRDVHAFIEKEDTNEIFGEKGQSALNQCVPIVMRNNTQNTNNKNLEECMIQKMANQRQAIIATTTFLSHVSIVSDGQKKGIRTALVTLELMCWSARSGTK